MVYSVVRVQCTPRLNQGFNMVYSVVRVQCTPRLNQGV